ncbi:MFS transporter [Georgenia halophila]|uniref:MFS transporter n=1 Tax=Georgenia halophila TaxID=620889 RepID=A0ABP8LG85_9MICO
MTTAELYARLVRSPADAADGKLSPAVARRVPANGLRQIAAEALQSTGDQVVNPRTVLPWLFSALGVPAAMVGLLVPVRESGSLLPQAALLPWVRRRRRRRWVWVVGAAGQALSAAAMAVAAAMATGAVAGTVVLLALTAFSVSRSLTSLAGKDVLGRTVPAGQRGQINGLATVLAGLVAVTVGVGIRLLGDDGATHLAVLIAAGALTWVAALVVYTRVKEPDAEPDPDAAGARWAARAVALLRADAAFRRFVTVRALLLVTALSPPFVVALAAERGAGLSGLGAFVIASGLASLVGGRLFGRWADRSSRGLMSSMAAAGSGMIVVLLLLLALPGAGDWSLLPPAAYLLLALAHTGARVGRKTYVVDMAEGERRTEYVAVANSAMGVLLLVAGAVTGGLAVWGPEAALGLLALLGFGGVVMARRLPEVGAGRT